MELTYNEDQTLSDTTGKFLFKYVHEWYDYQIQVLQESNFADEEQISAELLPYVRAALSGGYIKLFSDYTYRVGNSVSREEVADIFAPLCQTGASAGKSESFTDFDEVSIYFEDHVKKIVDLDIMIGYPDGTFRPKDAITREELALVLYRFEQLEK